MLPVLSALFLLSASSPATSGSNTTGPHRKVHRFAGMVVGSSSTDSPKPSGSREDASDIPLDWNGFKLIARSDFRTSPDGRSGSADNLWIRGSCGAREVRIPSGPVRWEKGRLVDSLIFVAPARCEIPLPFENSRLGMVPFLYADTLVFDPKGEARVRGVVRVRWKGVSSRYGSNWLVWTDTVVAPPRFRSGARPPDSLSLRPDAKNTFFLSRGVVLSGGRLFAEGFQGWPGFPVPEIDRLEIDREGTPWNAPEGGIFAFPLRNGRFLTWMQPLAIREGVLEPESDMPFGLVELGQDSPFERGPLDPIGRRLFQAETTLLAPQEEGLESVEEILRSGPGGVLSLGRYRVPFSFESDPMVGRIFLEGRPGAMAGLTNSGGQLLPWPSSDPDFAPVVAPGTGLVLHLDPGIEISYRADSSGNPRHPTQAKARLGEWGMADVVVLEPYDAPRTSFLPSLTPIGYLRFSLDRSPPIGDFGFPWLIRWGSFHPGRNVRYSGSKDFILIEGWWLPNPRWRSITGRDSLGAWMEVPVVRNGRGDMRIRHVDPGNLRLFLPRGVAPNKGMEPIGIGHPHRLTIDSTGWGELDGTPPEDGCVTIDSLPCDAPTGWWAWKESPVAGGASRIRAIHQGGRTRFGPDGKAVSWEARWSGFEGLDSIVAPDGSVLAGCRRISLSWVESEIGVTEWAAQAPGLVRKTRGGKGWFEPQGGSHLTWVVGKGFSDAFETVDQGGGCRASRDSVALPKLVGALLVDRAPATVGSYRGCVAASVCSPLVPMFDAKVPAQAFDAAMADWPETRAENVGFAQAQAYCRFRSARLPTREEWAGLAASGCEPSGRDDLCEGASSPHPEPVAQGKPHANGLHDLGGMGPVWCADGKACPATDGSASNSVDGKPSGGTGVRCVADVPSVPAPSIGR